LKNWWHGLGFEPATLDLSSRSGDFDLSSLFEQHLHLDPSIKVSWAMLGCQLDTLQAELDKLPVD